MTRPAIPAAAPDAPFDVVFLDRDGTINVRVEGDYVRTAGDLVLLPGAGEAVAMLVAAGVRVVVVTNQRGVARDLMTSEDVDAVHARLDALLSACGGRVDAYLVCPHEVGECDCRKPAPGLVLEGLRSAPWADPGRCLLVGDSASDVAAGRAAGVESVLLPDDAPDLRAAVAAALGGVERQDRSGHARDTRRGR